MVLNEEIKRSPIIQKKTLMDSNSQNVANTLISPRFKSAAAMAGWDEEALLLATLIVEDTPDRDIKHKKRSILNSKSPRTNSTRKRRAGRISQSIPIAALDLDEEEIPKEDSEKKKKEKKKDCVSEESKVGENEPTKQNSSTLPCIDKIREELSCAICLDICYEPSTTPCGHSFCKKCLRSAADKCGKKCPKCRQLIGNGRSCTVNTSLWNTIQLLFPQEVEARKVAAASSLTSTINNNNNRQVSFQSQSQETSTYNNQRNRSIQPYASSRSLSSRRSQTTTTTQEDEDAALARRLQREIERQTNNNRTTTRGQSYSTTTTSERVRTRRGGVSNQDEDAAIALRLQREEFMQTFRNNNSQEQSTIPSSSLARANLRAMASRAMRRY